MAKDKSKYPYVWPLAKFSLATFKSPTVVEALGSFWAIHDLTKRAVAVSPSSTL